ncbi:hypothetical protein LCGC14_3165660 [marine sediment metagenome]|uniref:Uncharacterized protein n=1 Tax=marine sediment metagenome TaxID=412755 RepID=A0A0F8WBB0_9ZZZZ
MNNYGIKVEHLCPNCGSDEKVWEEMLHEKHLCPNPQQIINEFNKLKGYPPGMIGTSYQRELVAFVLKKK